MKIAAVICNIILFAFTCKEGGEGSGEDCRPDLSRTGLKRGCFLKNDPPEGLKQELTLDFWALFLQTAVKCPH